jgi:hypothetical protein
MTFQVDSGASVTFLGLNSFCVENDTEKYECLKRIVNEEIEKVLDFNHILNKFIREASNIKA